MSKQFDILVVDDESVIINAVDKICSAEGLKVDSSANAEEALLKVGKNTYRLIISDIMMPEIDGFQFLEALSKMKIKTPVIITTGFSTVENAVKSLYNGAIDFIPKPFSAEELISSVSRGLKYLDIQEKLVISENSANDASIIYVPCPAKYFRLGYASWAAPDNTGSVLVGVTDLFLKTIDSITEIELLKTDNEIVQGNSCAQIKSKDDLLHTVISPVSGRILERNDRLVNDTSIVEKDPYFNGWFYRIIPSDSEFELKQLIPCSSDRL
jgi:CheY-like chemotaxis protein/glycine cleavage system H lipoate-binding protein